MACAARRSRGRVRLGDSWLVASMMPLNSTGIAAGWSCSWRPTRCCQATLVDDRAGDLGAQRAADAQSARCDRGDERTRHLRGDRLHLGPVDVLGGRSHRLGRLAGALAGGRAHRRPVDAAHRVGHLFDVGLDLGLDLGRGLDIGRRRRVAWPARRWLARLRLPQRQQAVELLRGRRPDRLGRRVVASLAGLVLGLQRGRGLLGLGHPSRRRSHRRKTTRPRTAESRGMMAA